jgi:hypothetical protein
MLGGYGGVVFIIDGSYAGFRCVVVDIYLILARALLDSCFWII